jgi:hypothetical protein
VTGGFIAHAIFNTQEDWGVVALINTACNRESLTDRLANHVAQRLMGLPPISLAENAKN